MANMATSTCKGAKVILELEEDLQKASAHIGGLFKNAEEFQAHFPRLMSMIRCGVDTFVEGMGTLEGEDGESA